MPLDKNKISLSVQGGLDTKTDKPNVNNQNFLEVENAVYQKTSGFQKRNGYDALTTSILPSGSITAGQFIKPLENEILLNDGTKLYTYSAEDSKYVNRGPYNPCTSSAKSIKAGNLLDSTSTNAVCWNATSATTGQFTIYNYATQFDYSNPNNSPTASELYIVDNETGAVVYTATHTTAGAGYAVAWVSAISGKFYCITTRFNATAVMGIFTIDPVTLTVTANVSLTGPATNDSVTFKQIQNRIMFMWQSSSGPLHGFVGTVNTTLTVVTTDLGAAYAPVSINEENTYVKFVMSQGGTDVYSVIYHPNLSGPVTSIVFWNTFAGYTVFKSTSIQRPGSTTQSLTYLEMYDFTNFNHRVYVVLSNSSAILQQLDLVGIDVQLMSQVANINDKLYMLMGEAPVGNGTANNYICSTYMVQTNVDGTDWITVYPVGQFYKEQSIGRILYGGASVATRNWQLPELIGTSALSAPITTLATVQPTTGLNPPIDTQVLLTNIKEVSVTPLGIGAGTGPTANGSEYMSGAVNMQYDGLTRFESLFLNRPKILSTSTTAGTNFGPGTYQLVVVYRYQDRSGNIIRSAPSDVITVTLGGAVAAINLVVQSPRFTYKANVFPEVYRTVAAGTIFYLSGSNYSPLPVFTTPMTIGALTASTFEVDAGLTDNEVLYTTGGVVPNDAPQPAKILIEHKRRIFGLSSVANSLFYSQQFLTNEPVLFSDSFYVPLTNKGGEAVSIASLDGHLIILKESAVFALDGDGPTPTGQGEYPDPQLVTTDTGCVDSRSVVTTPFGIMFKSSKGIMLLNRGLTMEYVGAPVEAYNGETVVSATLMSTTNEVRFATDMGSILSFDYFHKKWAVSYILDGTVVPVDACLTKVGTSYIYSVLAPNGVVYKENSNSWSDSGTYVGMKITSAWINVAGIQGFERLYNIKLLNTFYNQHLLKVSFAYDYNDTYTEFITIDTATLPSTNPYEVTIRPSRQKCMSFKFKVEDLSAGVVGQSLSISNFAMEIGVKRGNNKQAAAASFGSSSGT